MTVTSLNIDPTLLSNSFDKERKLKKALKGFESMFVQQLLKSMRSAYLSDDSKGGLGMDTMMSISDQALADYIGDNDGLGIAKILYKYFQNQMNGESLKQISVEPESIEIDNTENDLDISVKEDIYKLLDDLNNQGCLKINDISKVKIEKTPRMPSKSYNDLQVNATAPIKSAVSAGLSIDDKISQAVSDSAARYDISEKLIKAVMQVESGGNHLAISEKGAKGLMQLVDSTAADMGVKNIFDPAENIEGGAKYLRKMLDQFGGDLKMALAGYNAGPGNVEKYGGIPPFDETRTYVNKVINIMNSGNESKDSKLSTEN